MPDFWRNSGFHLLERDAAGRLRVTDDFLRAYLLRPEMFEFWQGRDNRLHDRLVYRAAGKKWRVERLEP